MGIRHHLAYHRAHHRSARGRAYASLSLAAVLPLACGLGAGRAGTLDDHDHRSAVAAVEAMDGHAARQDVAGAAGIHLRGLPTGTASSEDSARADLLVLEMRDALRRYQDTAVAAADGFAPLSADGPVAPDSAADADRLLHLVNWKWALAEEFRFNPARPTALVYRRRRDGRRTLVGAMYSAPDGATAAELDRRVPVRIGRWHQHVDWCTPKRGDDARWTETARDGTPVFGPESRIATRAACDSVAGSFHARIFGWMLHANLFTSDDPDAIWRAPVAPADGQAPVTHASADAADSSPSSVPSMTASSAAAASASTLAGPAAAAPAPTAAATPVTAASTPAPAPTPGSAPKAKPGAPAPPVVTNAPPPPSPTIFARGARPRVVERARLGGAAGASAAGASAAGAATTAVPYTRFAAGKPGAHHPALLMLEGVDAPADTAAFWQSAAALARSGYVVAVLRYDSAAETVVRGGAAGAHEEWQRRVNAGIAALAADPQVDSARIGILGVKAGARVALVHAARDRRVKCVVDYFAGTPRDGGLIQRMPPVEIIAMESTPGEVTEATELRNLLAVLHVPTDVHVYATRAGTMAPSDRLDAGRAVTTFLAKYLKPAVTTP